MFRKNGIVLLQGDSITDAGRDRALPLNLGQGYPLLLAAHLLYERPSDCLTFINRGVSGNRIVDLYARWSEDALSLKPDVISILIGVNDIWHEFRTGTGVEAERFEHIYSMLLSETVSRLPAARLILCEPFCLRGTATEERWDGWSAEIANRQAIVRALAERHGCVFVPLQETFNQALNAAPAAYWLHDGVHPTAAGHELMKRQWLRICMQ